MIKKNVVNIVFVALGVYFKHVMIVNLALYLIKKSQDADLQLKKIWPNAKLYNSLVRQPSSTVGKSYFIDIYRWSYAMICTKIDSFRLAKMN